VLAHDPSGKSLAQIVLLLTPIWWMYAAFAYLTNAVPPTRTALRVPLLAGMAAFFAISLTVPTAFTDNGVVFAGGYLIVIVIHGALYTQAAAWSLASVWSFTRLNLVTAGLLLTGAIIGGAWQYCLFAAVIPFFLITPFMVTQADEDVWINPSHFVERHGLVVIVALGESVVAVGIGASGIRISSEMIAIAILGLILSAELWWTYFGGDEEEAERALGATQPTRKKFLAMNAAYYWAHLLILLGIVCLAAALERAIGHAFDPLDFARALALGGGTALFLLGDVLFRRLLGLAFRPWRAVGIALALATIPLGTEASALVQLGILVAALGICVALEGAPAPQS
jgi:low temperature requirement protein LtrA